MFKNCCLFIHFSGAMLQQSFRGDGINKAWIPGLEESSYQCSYAVITNLFKKGGQ